MKLQRIIRRRLPFNQIKFGNPDQLIHCINNTAIGEYEKDHIFPNDGILERIAV